MMADTMRPSTEIEVTAEVLDLATTKPAMPSVSFEPAAINADFGQMLEWANAIKATYFIIIVAS